VKVWFGHPGRAISGASPRPGFEANATVSVWAKPVSATETAVMVVSMARPGSPGEAEVAIDLKAVGAGFCVSSAAGCAVRDLWAHEAIGSSSGSTYTVTGLAPHDSIFLTFTAK